MIFASAAELPGWWQSSALAAAAVLSIAAVWFGRGRDRRAYSPDLAWLRAGAYFALCVWIAIQSGVLAHVLHAPLATPDQFADPKWWGLTLVCLAVVVTGYALIWPRGTFHDDRVVHPFLSLAYGSVWGLCQGVLFLSIWAVLEQLGLAVLWVAIGTYLLIGAYNGCWHHFVWDIYVSPPHNYSEWNGKKVLLCHTPNLLFCLTYLAIYGNAGIYVLLQGFALAASAFAMRFPAPWDDYSAVAGEERSLARAAT